MTDSGKRTWVYIGWLLVVGLLAGALLLTILRLAQPVTTLVVELVGLSPLAMPLYAIALLVALVPTVRHRGRTMFLVPTGVALIGLVLHAVWFAPQVSAESRAADGGAPSLTVMAVNLLKGQADAADLLQAAQNDDVDVLVGEEVTPQAWANLEAEGLSSRYPYRAGEAARGVVGTMVFSRVPLSEPERLATGFGSWRVEVGDDLTLLAVHTTAPSNPDGWRTDFKTLLASVDEASPDLILGDFNATADHEPMRELGDGGFRDAGELTNTWRPTWPANNLAEGVAGVLPPLARIDQILVGPEMAALSANTVRIDDTDHLAVVATVARAH